MKIAFAGLEIIRSNEVTPVKKQHLFQGKLCQLLRSLNQTYLQQAKTSAYFFTLRTSTGILAENSDFAMVFFSQRFLKKPRFRLKTQSMTGL